MQARLMFAILCATNLCIRGSRVKWRLPKALRLKVGTWSCMLLNGVRGVCMWS